MHVVFRNINSTKKIEYTRGNTFFINSNNEIPKPKKLYALLEYLYSCNADEKDYFVSSFNYEEMISDPEIRSFFRQNFIDYRSVLNFDEHFLFLLPISENGYNFGQFRIVSHLISIGIPIENFSFFLLIIKNGKYIYSKKKLMELIRNKKPKYVCEIVYSDSENETQKINKIIRDVSNALILVGGPYTAVDVCYSAMHFEGDVFFLGHGEYIIEEFLMQMKFVGCVQKINMPPEMYIKEEISFTQKKVMLNKYMDCLEWNYDLLPFFINSSDVINIFTSEECHGNCLFCYRHAMAIENCMKNRELLKRIKKIIEKKPQNAKYIRFFDDDFFASKYRNSDFVYSLAEILSNKISLYELTFSVRSIDLLIRKEGNEIIKAIQMLNLKRVTIGIDGFNNNDLIRLQKGYTIQKAFDVTDRLSESGIRVLSYCILTTFETSIVDLYASLINMIDFVIEHNGYIGPTITPQIYLLVDNKKLIKKFQDEKFCFLEVDKVKKNFREADNRFDMYMGGKVLPFDRIVRKVVCSIQNLDEIESAYVLPVMGLLFKYIALEINYLNSFKENTYTKYYQELSREENRINRLGSYLTKIGTNVIPYLNYENKLKRKKYDMEGYISLIKEGKVEEYRKMLLGIVDDYEKYAYNIYCVSNEEKYIKEKVRRLVLFPLEIYNLFIKNDLLKVDLKIDRRDYIKYKDDIALFWRCLKNS